MLHILFMILKIIGIILLAILGILILLSLIVLFAPMKYWIKAESKGDLKTTSVHAKMSWLFHLVSGQVVYENEKLQWKLRVAWKTFSEAAKGEKAVKEAEAGVEKLAGAMDEESAGDKEADHSGNEEQKSEQKSEEKAEEKSEKQAQQTEHHRSKKKEPTESKQSEKKKYTIQKICDKIKSCLSKKDKIVAFLKDEANIATFTRLKKELSRLMRFLKPKKIKGMVRFGTEDPYLTGQILAVLSVLYPFYGENVEIYPEFDRKILEGDLEIKGHIRGSYVVIIMWNLIWDKNVRTAFKNIKTWK